MADCFDIEDGFIVNGKDVTKKIEYFIEKCSTKLKMDLYSNYEYQKKSFKGLISISRSCDSDFNNLN